MNVKIRNFALSALLLSATALEANTVTLPADGTQIGPLQAHTAQLAEYTAVVYYTVLANGDYEVVTTYGPNEGVSGVATRNRVILSLDQSYSFNVDQGLDAGVVPATTITALPHVIRIAQQ